MRFIAGIVAAGLLAGGAASSPAQPEKSYPVKTIRDFVALAKSRPNEIAYVTFGTGSMPHVAGELFQQLTGTVLLHVPYRGGGPALTGLLSGETLLYWPGIAIAIPHIKTGKLRALGVAGKFRPEELPDLPALAEQLKAPDYDVTSVFAFMAPAGTPRPIRSKLHAGIAQALALPEVRKTYASLGATSPQSLAPEDTLAMLRSESIRWGKVLRAAHIKSN